MRLFSLSLVAGLLILSGQTILYLPVVQNGQEGPTSTPIPTPTQPSPCPCDADTLNCANFPTQPAAQSCYEHCLALTGRDIHRLDADGNGIACESLPPGWSIMTGIIGDLPGP